jgi:hypothetical protein
MAALTITAANVKQISGSQPTPRKIATGQTITAGMLVYLDNNLVKVAGVSSAFISGSAGLYVALSGGTADQWISLANVGAIINLGVGVVGKFYFLGASGTFHPDQTHLTTGNYVTLAGYINTSGYLVLKPTRTSTAIPA